MNMAPFSGVDSAISTSIPYALAYSPLISAQSFELFTRDLSTFYTAPDPLKLLSLTVCTSSPCPGKA
jgi:hypothetical protein